MFEGMYMSGYASFVVCARLARVMAKRQTAALRSVSG